MVPRDGDMIPRKLPACPHGSLRVPPLLPWLRERPLVAERPPGTGWLHLVKEVPGCLLSPFLHPWSGPQPPGEDWVLEAADSRVQPAPGSELGVLTVTSWGAVAWGGSLWSHTCQCPMPCFLSGSDGLSPELLTSWVVLLGLQGTPGLAAWGIWATNPPVEDLSEGKWQETSGAACRG